MLRRVITILFKSL